MASRHEASSSVAEVSPVGFHPYDSDMANPEDCKVNSSLEALSMPVAVPLPPPIPPPITFKPAVSVPRYQATVEEVAETEYDVPDWMEDLSHFVYDEKAYARAKFEAGSARNNVKEAKKREYKKRKRKRKGTPHAENSPDPSPSTPLSSPITGEEVSKLVDKAETSKSLMDTTFNEMWDTFLPTFQTMAKEYESTVGKDREAYQSSINKVASMCEGLIFLIYQIYRSRNLVDFVVAVLQFVKTHTRHSLAMEFYEVCNNFCIKNLGEDLMGRPCSKSVTPHAENEVELGEYTVLEYWELFRNNEAYSRIGLLITTAICAVGCDIHGCKWTPFNIEVFAADAYEHQMTATNVADALLKTFFWFRDTGIKCYASGSLTPILFSDQRIETFNREYDNIVAQHSQVLNGNVDISLSEFEAKIQKSIDVVVSLKKVQTEKPTAHWLQLRYSTLTDILEKVQIKRRGQTSRRTPIGIGITGSSGTSKSALTMSLEKVAYYALTGKKWDESLVGLIDQFEKYQSGWTSDKAICRIDDTGHTTPGDGEFHLVGTILKFWNTVAATACKAELQDKGRSVIDFEVGSITSNFDDLGAQFYTERPEAALRRFIFVRTEVKPEYRQHGSLVLDTSKLKAGELIQDIWNLTLETIATFKDAAGNDKYKFVHFMFTDRHGRYRKAVNVDYIDAHLAVQQYVIKHRDAEEKAVVARKNFVAEDMCKGCGLANGMCVCTVKDEPVEYDEDVEPTPVPVKKSSKQNTSVATNLEFDERLADMSTVLRLNLDKEHEEKQAKKLVHLTETLPRREAIVRAQEIYSEWKKKTKRAGHSKAVAHSDFSAAIEKSIDAGVISLTKLETVFIDGALTTAHGLAKYAPTAGIFIGGMLCLRAMDFARETKKKGTFEMIKDAYGIWKEASTFSLSKSIERRLAPFKGWSWYGGLLSFKPIHKYSAKKMSECLVDTACDVLVPKVFDYIPEFIYSSRPFQQILTSYQKSSLLYEYRNFKYCGLMCTLFGARAAVRSKKLLPLIGGLAMHQGINVLVDLNAAIRTKAINERFAQSRDSLSTFVKEKRDSKVIFTATTALAVGIGLAALKIWYDGRETHAEKEDTNESWFGSVFRSIWSKSEPSSTSSKSADGHIENKLVKAIARADIVYPDGSKSGTNVLTIKKGYFCFPRHAWYKNSNFEDKLYDSMQMIVRFNDRPGSTFKLALDHTCTYFHERLDLCCVFTPNGPDVAENILEWFNQSVFRGHTPGIFLHKDKQGKIVKENVMLTSKSGLDNESLTGHSNLQFPGCEYPSKTAKPGTCFGPIISAKDKCVVALHIAGVHGVLQTTGVGMAITKNVLIECIDLLSKRTNVRPMASGDAIPHSTYGIQSITGPVHPKATFYKSPLDTCFTVHGSTRLRHPQKSEVRPSILSEAVTEVTGVENSYGPPQLKPNWKAFDKSFEHIRSPALPFLPGDLEAAREDFIAPLRDAMREYVKHEDFRPLTRQEAIMGINGKDFIDPLNMQTSMGFPKFGAKSKNFTDIRCPKGTLIDRIASSDIMQEWERLERAWGLCRRAFPIMSATLKDEPTKLDSDKVRVFQCAPVALSLAIRMFFLPVARFFGKHPTLVEQAVGINAFSKEWDHIMDFATKYDDEEVIAWDYSKFDLRMNSQMTECAWSIMIELAEIGGYDERSLQLMRSMVADIVHPLIDWNGSMLQTYCSNPSGHSMTVVVNGLVGSLYVRLGFLGLYKDVLFRDAVAAMTYGDDFIGSVNKEYREFHAQYYRDYLAKHDIKITPPDKHGELKKFTKILETDFLKRKSNHIPEIGCSLGALDEDSIFKSLHNTTGKKKAEKADVALQVVATACHEFFNHGKEKYEERCTQLDTICEKNNLVTDATCPFEERVIEWKRKYS